MGRDGSLSRAAPAPHARRGAKEAITMAGNASPDSGRSVQTSVFVDQDWLANHLDDPAVRVVEVDVSRAAFSQGHIPGAVLWNAYVDLHHADYRPLTRNEFEDLLSRSGIAPEDTVVFYGYGRSLGFWLLQAYGHKRALVMWGSRDAWHGAGLPWTTDATGPARVHYVLPQESPRELVSLADVQAAIESGDSLVVDVRSDAEYVGERFWPSGATEGAGRAGHMPGAVHLRSELLYATDGALKTAVDLRDLLQSHGVLPGRPVIIYCTIGNRASEAATVLKYVVGYPDVRVYDGSWAEWGTRAGTPVQA
jgi:thiosulfate/3-mercaptopyruvate sulfurtransferase